MADSAYIPAGRSGAAQSRNRIYGPILAILAALPAVLWLWGFTVDDALITARVAAHLSQGLGSRFNAHGQPVDAVTPLGYAHLLALLGAGDGDTLAKFLVAKWVGLAAWLLAAGSLGLQMAGVGQRARRFTPLLIVGVSAPLAAWSVSGMETGVVTLLVTLGLSSGALSALSLGLAAAWRPELAPFALVLVALRAREEGTVGARLALQIAFAVLPGVSIALLRWAWFGRAVPLSFYAKPSDFAHGLRYALGGLAFSGLPCLLVAKPSTWARCPRPARALLAALAAHFFALVLCGGDWMALYRLVVPVLPCVALAAAYLADQARPVPAVARLLFASASALLLAIGLGPDARHVGADRARLIATARPVLAHDERIAALDVGWLGAASDAEVIDLAGVTDPEVAFFQGGHTSKRIPSAWLFSRRPTAIVLLLARGAGLEVPFEQSAFARNVEQRVAQLVAAEFRVRTTLDLAGQTYVVLEPAPTP
ncbi:MAG TPA: hypothetical protein VHW01_18450 [Polyangiaceae bacterium]|nr:hypothetical protein [Polyangiaceae bacterium]